jgi:phosphoribosylformylglycinamidine synthase I
MKPRIGVVVFPGSNDDRDAAEALAALGAEPVRVWHADEALPDLAGVVLPGGFSYGDYLRAGAIARFSPAMRAVSEFAAQGGLVLGICNGFQVLCEAGLLPGALRPNTSLSFVCRDVSVVVERTDTPFTASCDRGQELVIPVKHGEGCYIPPPDLDGHVVLRYAAGDNPNGSLDDIAGVANERGNVMGLMPHPEHAVDPLLGSADGALILGSLVSEAERARQSRVLG